MLNASSPPGASPSSRRRAACPPAPVGYIPRCRRAHPFRFHSKPSRPALQRGTSKIYRYLLVLRFAVLNLAASALLGTAYAQGWRKKGWVGLGRNRVKIRDFDALQHLVDTELDG